MTVEDKMHFIDEILRQRHSFEATNKLEMDKIKKMLEKSREMNI